MDDAAPDQKLPDRVRQHHADVAGDAIGGLERTPGQVLIWRRRTGPSPTAAGELACQHALAVIGAEAQFRDRVAAPSGRIAGQRRVMVNMFMSQARLAPGLTTLRQD